MTQLLLPGRPALSAPGTLPAVLSLLLATSAWGTLFFVGRHVLHDVDPLWFTAIRYALAAVLLLAFHPVAGRTPLSRLPALAARLASYGLAGYGAFSVLVFIGLTLSVPSHAAVVMATMPVSTVLLRWWSEGIRPPRRALLACAIAIAGVTLVSGPWRSGVAASAVAGDLLAFLGTFGWIVYTRGAARFPELSPFDYTAFTAFVTAPVLLLVATIASLSGAVQWPGVDKIAMHAGAFSYVAALPTVIAAVAFNRGVRTLGPATGTLFINAVPLSAMAIATALGQPPAAQELAGAVLVAAALVLATRR